jgi:hypothetical protein
MVSHSKPLSYHIRESRRAKHVSIQVSLLGDVEVVVPVGFDQNKIPALVQERRNWITRTVQQLRAERQAITPSADDVLPDEILLRSRSEQWHITYLSASGSSVQVSTLPNHHLLLTGNIDDHQTCCAALQQWLRRQARTILVPWLKQVSREIDLPFQRVTIRGQRTRWASCSSQQSISLNYKLLFLPPELVRYVFVHELCHTLQMNHSPNFWALVEDKDPQYRPLDAELRKAWRYVPTWAERSTKR